MKYDVIDNNLICYENIQAQGTTSVRPRMNFYPSLLSLSRMFQNIETKGNKSLGNTDPLPGIRLSLIVR